MPSAFAMSRLLLIVVSFAAVSIGSLLAADDSRGIRLGQATTSQWRFGVVVTAAGGPVSGITATLPVPMDWPEQAVKRVGEDKTPNVGGVSYKTLDGGVRQMVVTIPRLASGAEAS